jgi:hypothetical protein
MKLVKGSPEAKAYMAKIRKMRNGGEMKEKKEMMTMMKEKKPMMKGSDAMKRRMAELRAMRK